SGDSIDKLFDEGNDAGQEHSVERDDDVLEETAAKGASEVVAEKTKKKQKRKVVGDASGHAFPPKKLRKDYHAGASDDSHRSYSYFEFKSFARSPAKDAPVTTVVVTTTVTANASIVPPPKVRVV
nr:hypothetical protein [Tanacetum cinerariifolium]